MNAQHIAAFSFGNTGGNPAGVVIQTDLPSAAEMQALAREIGYSETVFAAPDRDKWRVRYYAPDGEVAFCGHATIALGVALGQKFNAGKFDLNLSNGTISVTAHDSPKGWVAELSSPETWSKLMPADMLAQIQHVFDITDDQLDPRLPATLGFAGVQHAILALQSRTDVARMAYDFEAGRALMKQHDLTTISLLYIESETEFVSRNAFASGGVVEDPATGAAAAALGGALIDLDWPTLRGGGEFTIRQGEDMGQPSLLNVRVSGRRGDSVRVSGTARQM